MLDLYDVAVYPTDIQFCMAIYAESAAEAREIAKNMKAHWRIEWEYTNGDETGGSISSVSNFAVGGAQKLV